MFALSTKMCQHSNTTVPMQPMQSVNRCVHGIFVVVVHVVSVAFHNAKLSASPTTVHLLLFDPSLKSITTNFKKEKTEPRKQCRCAQCSDACACVDNCTVRHFCRRCPRC